MLLRITDLTLRNFRSYSDFDLQEIGGLTIFVGMNATGKTNAIEAIQLLTSHASFRNAPTRELIRRGTKEGYASISLEDGNRKLKIDLKLEEGKRKYLLNEKPKQPKDLKGMLPSVVFTPDDLDLIKGSNTNRRREMDILGSQLNANYYQIMRDFEKILRHKNSLLKDEDDHGMLSSINEIFTTVGQQMTNYRSALFERLMPITAKMYGRVSSSKETLTGEYMPSWQEVHEDASDMAQAIQHLEREERQRGRALVGPHLDTIRFFLDGMEASRFGSQGQQRTIVLALKLAQAQLIEDMMNQDPVLLLDDVMSELDASRREALVENLMKDRQTFITTANLDYFDSSILDSAKVVPLS